MMYDQACKGAVDAYLQGQLVSEYVERGASACTFMGLPPPQGHATWFDYARTTGVLPKPVLLPPPAQETNHLINLGKALSAYPLPPPPQPAPAVRVPIAAPPKKINVRQKGQRGEREVIKLLQGLVDIATTKHGLEPVFLQRNMLQAHAGGCDLHGLDGFAIEVKFQEIDWNPAWWKQAVQQAQDMSVRGKDIMPILFWRKSNVRWMVMARMWVQTPHERDQVQLDVSMNLDQFQRWFESAIDEAMERVAANL